MTHPSMAHMRSWAEFNNLRYVSGTSAPHMPYFSAEHIDGSALTMSEMKTLTSAPISHEERAVDGILDAFENNMGHPATLAEMRDGRELGRYVTSTGLVSDREFQVLMIQMASKAHKNSP